MNILIVSNGDIEDYGFYNDIIKETDFIICADGGARHLRNMDLIPDIILGDLDSINTNDKNFFLSKNVKFIKYPEKKDFTDTEIATDMAIGMKPDLVTFIGTLGNRFDHSISNINLLIKLLNNNIKGKIVNEYNEIYMINDRIELRGKPGDILSIIPITNTVNGVTLKGLEYPLENAEISFGSSIGVSNKFSGEFASVEIKEGLLLVIKSRD